METASWLDKLETKVLFIQKRTHLITDEREKAVLECMLDGLSISAIGQHMRLSRRHIYTIKNSIVDQISHSAHFSQDVTKQKCV